MLLLQFTTFARLPESSKSVWLCWLWYPPCYCLVSNLPFSRDLLQDGQGITETAEPAMAKATMATDRSDTYGGESVSYQVSIAFHSLINTHLVILVIYRAL